MKKKIEMTNTEIYTVATLIRNTNVLEIILPIKVGFFMRRNIKKILDLVQEIDETRTDIGMRYGSFDEEAQAFKIDDGNLSIADDELKSLMSIKQEFEIDVISLEDFGNIEMTPSQIDAIMFMIEAE